MNTTAFAAVTPAPLITDQLNTEWHLLASRPMPPSWQMPALATCSSLAEALDVITRVRRNRQADADAVLLALLTRRVDFGDELAGRVVLQVMLGRAVNLARRAHHFGAGGIRGDLAQLTAAAVAALWNAIATYPVHRRRRKISVNLCMDALGHFTALLDDRAPDVVDGYVLDTVEPLFAQDAPAPAVELLGTLAWGVDAGVISASEASLLTRVYCPGPGHDGGSLAVARQLGLTPATVRQRCSRATHRLAAAVRAHDATAAHAA